MEKQIDNVKVIPDNVKKDMYKRFTGIEYIPFNYIIEGLLMGSKSVKSPLRREWMTSSSELLIHRVKNPQINISNDDRDNIIQMINAFVYFIEMNQDINGQLIYDGFTDFISHLTTCDNLKYERNNIDKDVEFYIPTLEDLHPVTQSVIKVIFGELYLIHLSILIYNNNTATIGWV